MEGDGVFIAIGHEVRDMVASARQPDFEQRNSAGIKPVYESWLAMIGDLYRNYLE
jgi:hypothetical protein